FFQAEDGIRDYKVTGVQTCALPILAICCSASLSWPSNDDRRLRLYRRTPRAGAKKPSAPAPAHSSGPPIQEPRMARETIAATFRSEERRVGKEWRARWRPEHYKKKE